MSTDVEALPRNLLAFGRGARRLGFDSEHGRQLLRVVADAQERNYHAGIVYGQALQGLANVMDLDTRRPRWETIVLAIEALLEHDARREFIRAVPDEAWPSE